MNVETEKQFDEAATPTPHVVNEKRDRPTEADWFALVMRQQELIVRQAESLIRAMNAMDSATGAMSLQAQVDELLLALARVTPTDMVRVGELIKSLFDMLKGAVGGGAVRSEP